tara:strand:+ start:101 stop:208 length:108 start_codon:yes stop_codon:yes gene_type:complete
MAEEKDVVQVDGILLPLGAYQLRVNALVATNVPIS